VPEEDAALLDEVESLVDVEAVDLEGAGVEDAGVVVVVDDPV
jgi:hypothetical protein